MNLDDLRRAKNRERETDSLQELPDSFYADVADYIRERKAERATLADDVDDPFSSEEISRLSDEIATAERIAESLYERRVGKVVKQASFAAADMGNGSEENLTAEERDLYGDLVDRIRQNKHRVVDVIGGEAADETGRGAGREADAAIDGTDAGADSGIGGAAADSPEAETDDAPDADAAALMGGDDARDDGADGSAGSGDDVSPSDGDGGEEAADRTTVRITRDVGEIFGVDQRTYTLETDDVVTLPAENAAPLVERDAAETLE